MRSVFFVTQKVLPRIPEGGRIINISSGVTRFKLPGIPAYSATKGLVDVLTLRLATSLGGRKITVNARSWRNRYANERVDSSTRRHRYAQADSAAAGHWQAGTYRGRSEFPRRAGRRLDDRASY